MPPRSPRAYGQSPVRPGKAFYHPQMKEFFLMYDDVRLDPSPRSALLEFLQSTYEAGANLAKWDRAELERTARWAAKAHRGLEMRHIMPSRKRLPVLRFGPPYRSCQRLVSSLSKICLAFRYLSKVTDGSYHETSLIRLWRPRLSIPRPATRSRHWCNFSARAPPRRSGSACTTTRQEVRGGRPARPSLICGK